MMSIRTKLILFISTLIIIIGALSCLFFLVNSKKQQEDALRRFGISLIMLFAQDDEVKHALSYTQPAFLDTPIKRIKALDTEGEIGYLRISNTQKIMVEEKAPWITADMGKIPTGDTIQNPGISFTNRMWTRGGIRHIDSSRNPDVLITNNIVISLIHEFYDFSLPIIEKHTFSEEEFAAQILGDADVVKEDRHILGFVQIGLSRHKLHERIHAIVRRSIIPIGITIIAGGVCITFFLTKYIISPIKHMANITLDIAKGNLTRTVDIRSKDEIGQLSINFNQMTNALKNSYDEKEKIMVQLREHITNLFQTNKELTKINEQLNDAQERLVRSEKLAAIGKLASGIGHELRNPLSCIKNALFIIRKKPLPIGMLPDNQRINQLIEIVEKETERSIKIVNDLLEFSRTTKPTVSPTNIHSLIESSFSRLTIPEKIKRTVRIEEPLPLIPVDATQIEQVFINLIQNACDAMPMGGLLTIHVQKENSSLTVTFTDTGYGIPDTIKNKIFDPLFTTKPKGMGLGLAISFNIIQRHGGNIDLKSKEGEGTSFIVTLPTEKADGTKTQTTTYVT
ncbi:MAG: Sensor protein of zinc sigma-54-dependent two-component system [Candidatus Jettenia ecosi]|uniref:histidine kinase n=1 Tax=Candidatus Jettenia ecosi TaxID=2494326 RepID=A0A533QBQ1_9BACT|nr:MAG: Sensor protein of zinc sigma-54-dependent two-component system [Candidatus Jettenia ecosi]